MQKKLFIGIMMMALGVGVLITVSCTKKTVVSDTATSNTETVTPASVPMQTVAGNHTEVAGSEDSSAKPQAPGEKRVKEEQRHQAKDTRRNETAGRIIFLNELVLFDFDSSILTTTAQDRLKQKAQWLVDNTDVSVIIQGYCDERGSEAYNLALGENRAQAAKAFLIDLGISASRLSTVSYGEERPFAQGHDEGAWRLNRRAHFVIDS
jgi:peptidoglycan-associated lipoprotein